MSRLQTENRWYSVNGLDVETRDIIRILALRFHVNQAEIIEEAIFHFDDELGKSIPLPEGWRKPRDW